MQYMHAMPSAYPDFAGYLNMWRAIIANELFHDLHEISETQAHWDERPAPHHIITGDIQNGDARDEGFTLDQHSDQLQAPQTLSFSRRYPPTTNVQRNQTPMREWDIVILRNYRAEHLDIQQCSYLAVVTNKQFEGAQGTERGATVRYEAVVLGTAVPRTFQGRPARRNSTGTRYLSGEVVNYCGTTVRSVLALADIENSAFIHLKELLCGRIGEFAANVQVDADGNGFIDGFVNQQILTTPNAVPDIHAVLQDLTGRFGLTDQGFQRYITAAYDDEATERARRDRIVRPLNISQVLYIAQVVHDRAPFDDYTPLRRRMTALIGPAGTGKTQTLMSAIAATYALVNDGGQSAVLFERLRREWAENTPRPGHRPVTVNQLNRELRRTRMPKILVVAPTNNAVDVLERRLQEGIPVYDGHTQEWVNVSPVYRRYGSDEDGGCRGYLRRQCDLLIPPELRRANAEGITLCTLGSVYRAFPFRDRLDEWTFRRPYQYVFVHEASQVSDSDLFPLFDNIAFLSTPYEERWPRISFLGDPYQLPPNTRAQRPQCYYYTKKLSFLERMTPECSPFLRGLNKTPTVQLNTQYRMVPEISEVANIVARRDVRTRIIPPDRSVLTTPIRNGAYPPMLFNGFFADFPFAAVSQHLLWVDPYVDPRHAAIDIVQKLNDEVDNNYEEVSPLEAVAVEAVYSCLMSEIPELEAVGNMSVLSPYPAQCNLVRRMMQIRYLNDNDTTREGYRMALDSISTVSSCQGMEHDLVIFTAGRGPLDTRQVGRDSLLDSLRDLYVLITRARCNLVIIASQQYMQDNCQSWARLIQHFMRTTA